MNYFDISWYIHQIPDSHNMSYYFYNYKSYIYVKPQSFINVRYCTSFNLVINRWNSYGLWYIICYNYIKFVWSLYSSTYNLRFFRRSPQHLSHISMGLVPTSFRRSLTLRRDRFYRRSCGANSWASAWRGASCSKAWPRSWPLWMCTPSRASTRKFGC